MSDLAQDDVLAALRHATAERHALLDNGLAIGGEHATLAHYQAHLRMLYAWLLPMEAWLAGFDDGPNHEPSLPPRGRAALIARDLADPAMRSVVSTPPGHGSHAPHPHQSLQATSASAGEAASIATPAWPAQASAAYRWGVCYVAEGSQLGGAVLYQRLKDKLAPHPLAYLKGESEGPGPRWRAFMLALRRHVRGEAAVAEACRGACDAFDRILALKS